jgi:RNA polymerase sigma-70 factor (ECF subfamily)
LTGETGRADELAQETFLRAFETKEHLSEVRSVRSWLYRIAYRRFLDDHRRHVRRAALEPEPDILSVKPRPGLALDIAKAMDSLPPERRACAMLSLALGHSHNDIVDITGLPLGTVKSHIARAKSVLKDRLHEYE